MPVSLIDYGCKVAGDGGEKRYEARVVLLRQGKHSEVEIVGSASDRTLHEAQVRAFCHALGIKAELIDWHYVIREERRLTGVFATASVKAGFNGKKTIGTGRADNGERAFYEALVEVSNRTYEKEKREGQKKALNKLRLPHK